MTDRTTTTISVDQFIAAPPAKVWRALTEPELLARWWAAGDIAATVGHRFDLDMPGWGAVPCEVVEVEPERRFVYTFTENWTLVWRLVPEGAGTRLFLDHSGFDLDDKRSRDAFERMGPGWRDTVLPRLAGVVADIGPRPA
ncbi:SRPBCC domain-containing protein [Rhodococcus sp. IEGM 1305]|uniref:SRPBCC family protein n=1 Tax=Rhodococcus sp. IEGM 1305 TaxID=3047092 RepID=UPI0024B83347|nr:SRPBCC domain-containing protein [Rhodococcus sp. IEGM 1305]MDI9953443.1 SRPBCC domain-containing protein [Rhodococcus sp. IEGM 1305]